MPKSRWVAEHKGRLWLAVLGGAVLVAFVASVDPPPRGGPVQLTSDVIQATVDEPVLVPQQRGNVAITVEDIDLPTRCDGNWWLVDIPWRSPILTVNIHISEMANADVGSWNRWPDAWMVLDSTRHEIKGGNVCECTNICGISIPEPGMTGIHYPIAVEAGFDATFLRFDGIPGHPIEWKIQ